MAALLSIPLLTIAGHLLVKPGAVFAHLLATVLGRYLLNTLILVLGVGSLSTLLGGGTAWIVSLYRFPGKGIFQWALVLPLTIPAYIAAFTYAGILDFTGPLQGFFRNTLGMPAGSYPVMDIMSLPGAILVMSLVLYPYVYLVTRASLLRQSASALEVARNYGMSNLKTLFHALLPLNRPALAGGAALVIMEVLNDYGTVHYFGVDTLTTGIFRTWFSLNERSSAIHLSAVLLLVLGLILLAEQRLRGRARYSPGGTLHRPLVPKSLDGLKGILASALCLLPLLFGFIIPLLQLLGWGVATVEDIPRQDLGPLMLNSFALAGVTTGFLVLIALLIAYAQRVNPAAHLPLLTRFATLGYAVPGAVIALGIMIPFSRLDHFLGRLALSWWGASTGLLLSGTLLALFCAYSARYFAVAFHPVESGFAKLGKNLEEASRGLGHGPLRTLLRVDLPLLRGTLLSASILTFIDLLKELPLTLILRPFNFDTLATRAFELAGDEMVPHSAHASLIIIGAGTLATILLKKIIPGGDP